MMFAKMELIRHGTQNAPMLLLYSPCEYVLRRQISMEQARAVLSVDGVYLKIFKSSAELL